MKKTVVLSIAILSVCFFVPISSANEEALELEAGVTNDSAQRIKEANQERKEEILQKAEQRKEERQNAIEERKQMVEEKRAKVCENIQKRVETRIVRYEKNKNAHQNVFSNMLSRLKNAIERFKQMGLETQKLEADLAVLEEKISNLYKVHDVFISELKITQDHACGGSEGEFRSKLGQARKMAPEVRAAILDVREYYVSVIRQDLLDLRVQLQDNAESEDANGADEDGEDDGNEKD